MPQQLTTAIENNFTKGLITESTGLNFPENAATSTSNCLYTLVGDVTRRLGIDFEQNYNSISVNRTNVALSTYIWNNPGNNSNGKFLVRQVGPTLFFYSIGASTVSNPLSDQIVGSINISTFVATNGVFDPTKECEYSDGIGYLFVYQSTCDPFYVSFNNGILSTGVIGIQIRDFIGLEDGLGTNVRPTALSPEHQYNLQNQGWTSGNSWGATSFDVHTIAQGITQSWFIGTGIAGITNGQIVGVRGTNPGAVGTPLAVASGTVVSYTGGFITLQIFALSTNIRPGLDTLGEWVFSPTSTGYLGTWFSAEGNYPSNSDVWWYFKDTSDVFNPTVTQPNVTLSTGTAPQGHYLLSAFTMNRAAVSGLSGLTTVSTTQRPSTGCWFQGRVWYTGVSAFMAASGDASVYSWAEKIYFSTIAETPSDFGVCYETNDPTSENLNAELATDGGYISIVGSGTIHKLFPIANGLLVFANNGVWFITGSQGIGFAANDYTITKISSVKVLSSHSFIDVLGLPFFWNEEGIYQVQTSQSGSLGVEPLTVGTILGFYNNIPLQCKKYARGDYDPVNYQIQWTYRSILEQDITSRYEFDTILNYNTYNKAFYPYTIALGTNFQSINGVNYISYPVISNSTPAPSFKYTSSYISGNEFLLQFSEEYDDNYVDWGQTDPANYTSFFITGYKIRGQAIRKFQPQYVEVFNRTNNAAFSYKIQGIWDFANDPTSGRWSTVQLITSNLAKADVVFKRHKLRGHGLTLQFKIQSVDGMPFDIIGWSVIDTVNVGA